VTSRARRRIRPISVALYVTDRTLRADIADACEDAGIAVADPDEPIGDVDVVLTDRPVETSVPVIALVSGEPRVGWPVEVCAVVQMDVDAATLAAIVTVVSGGYALVPRTDTGRTDVAREDAGAWADTGVGDDGLAIALTPREREVLALLSEGASNKEIAGNLAISFHTAKFHVASVTEKLGARSRAEAIAIAIRAGLVMM
jgi:DNA-binding CsgD family transcriptional regulator